MSRDRTPSRDRHLFSVRGQGIVWPWPRISTGRCEDSGWRSVAECSTWPLVELALDVGDDLAVEKVEVGRPWEPLAQKPVGVLVAPTPPRDIRVAHVDDHAGRLGQSGRPTPDDEIALPVPELDPILDVGGARRFIQTSRIRAFISAIAASNASRPSGRIPPRLQNACGRPGSMRADASMPADESFAA